MSPDRRTDGLLQMLEQNDEKHSSAHARLREDLRELEVQHEHLLSSLTLLKEELTKQTGRIDTPPNVENVIMTPRVLIAIVIFSVTLAGGIWSSTSGLRSDVRDILTRMEAQKLAADTQSRVYEVQSTALRVAVDDVKRQQELQQYQIQALKEVIVSGKPKS